MNIDPVHIHGTTARRKAIDAASLKRRVTRVAILASGTSRPPLPDGVTYLALPKGAIGEFPSVEADSTCSAAMLAHMRAGKPPRTFWCTRKDGHDGSHVAHVLTGQPVAAWVDDEKESAR